MTFDEFKDICFRLALEKGCDAAEIYTVTNDGFEVNVLKSEITTYSVARDSGLNLRVIFEGRNGYAYTEIMDDPESLVDHAIDNARAIESTDESPMHGACEYPVIEKKPNPVVGMTEDEKINIALNLERDTLAFDDRVNRMGYCAVQTGVSTKQLCNTLGLDARSADPYSVAIVEPILRQGEDEQSAFSFKIGPEIMQYDDIIKEAVDKALMQFNAKPVESGEYRVLLRNDVAADLLRAFTPMFSADNVQKGLSLLNGKLSSVIASENVSIVDDPFIQDNPRAFDDEGVPSVVTEVVSNGVLTSFLHNLKTALKDGVKSTSNAGRSGVSAPVDIAPSNFYIVKGEKSYNELVSELGSGLIITELSGMHAGLNPVSGDFSLIAKGLLVEGGNVIRSVDQITCAGNFLKLLNGIIAVGSDLRFGVPSSGRVGSPSLLIDSLVIAGK